MQNTFIYVKIYSFLWIEYKKPIIVKSIHVFVDVCQCLQLFLFSKAKQGHVMYAPFLWRQEKCRRMVSWILQILFGKHNVHWCNILVLCVLYKSKNAQKPNWCVPYKISMKAATRDLVNNGHVVTHIQECGDCLKININSIEVVHVVSV